MLNWQQIIKRNAGFIFFNVKENDFLHENDAVLRLKSGIIYIIVNFVNGKVYVGQTFRTFKKRYKLCWWKTTHNEHLANAVKKYGNNNFKILITEENKSQADLDILETHYILSFQSYKDEFGYNKTLGGKVNRQSPEIKEKKDIEKFNLIIQKSKDLYGENRFKYIQAKISDKSKINLICNECGFEFWQDVYFHLNKNRGCRKCSVKRQALNRTHSFEDFLEKARIKHNDEYEYYPEKFINLKTKTPIKHKICGQISEVKPAGHLIQGCNICRLGRLSKKQRKFVTITKDNEQFNFNSIKDAQCFINRMIGTNYGAALRGQHALQGSNFNYHGFNVSISTTRGYNE